MKKYILILILLFFGITAQAQQDTQFTNYMYNTVNFNPAYAGSRGVMSVFGLHRNQWIGLNGAPVTNTFSLNTPITNSNLGLGISIENDQIGPSVENNISADFSYTIATSEKFDLSFGIKASANLLDVDFNKLNIYNQGDNLSQQNIDNKFSPNIGAGIYFHSDKTYFGFSVPNFLETKHFDRNGEDLASSSVAAERMHYYFITGHVFDVNSNIKFKPALLTKIINGSPLQLDVSANVLFHEKFTLGLAYRWDAALSALAGFQISDSWFIGYGYDMEVTKLSNYNSGSHELFLRFELFKDYDNLNSPRFF
jgi:type IX secretion system PorP/SprF family membrane protein